MARDFKPVYSPLISKYLIVGRDVSERLNAESEMKFLEEKLWQAQKMESIGLLAGGIAHDFNNILSIIVNYTSLSLYGLKEDHPLFNHLKKVQTASNRAIGLARKLHTIGRKDDHKKKTINIINAIYETVDLLKSSLGKNIEVLINIIDKDLFVLAEETRIQQILMNLISNASHAMPNKTGTICVTASKIDIFDGAPLLRTDLAKGSYIKLSVTDDGPGIDEITLQRVFDPYFSTKEGKDNSGLGLAVVHGIVKNYKGAIDVETHLGLGTTFNIYLPKAN